MTPTELVELRNKCGLTQSQMALSVDMSLRNYQKLESGTVPIRRIHDMAFYYVALHRAVENRAPMNAPAAVRKLAMDFVYIYNND
jgi:predicted transcriptional regulator